MPSPRSGSTYGDLRARMVAEQLQARGISDERVLEAMASVPRERFVPEPSRAAAYADAALGIAAEQTISQPWIVAAICEALAPGPEESVLEVGTGSGYSAAVLARLAGSVVSVERIPELADSARTLLGELGVGGVTIRVGDGSLGDLSGAPYDAIAVHAAAPGPPPALLEQLAPGGRLVVPVASGGGETLTLFRRRDDRDSGGPAAFERSPIAPCRFVPLVGEQGYPEQSG